MTDAPLYIMVQAGFALLTLVYVGLFLREILRGVGRTAWPDRRKKRFAARLIALTLLWPAFVALWSLSGKMGDFSLFPLNMMPVVLIPLFGIIAVMMSRSTGEILQNIPPDNIIRLQSFRVFVEILLWMLFIDSLLPVQMTFEGRNFDILAGLTAPIVAFLVARNSLRKTALVVWNFAGLGLLLNIIIISILSFPSPWRVFMNEPANFIVTRFPVSWLPAVLVPLAYYLHLISLKQMFAPSNK